MAKTKKGTITSEMAKDLIQRDILARIEKATAEVGATLEKHKCRLDVITILRNGQVSSQVTIVAKD